MHNDTLAKHVRAKVIAGLLPPGTNSKRAKEQPKISPAPCSKKRLVEFNKSPRPSYVIHTETHAHAHSLTGYQRRKPTHIQEQAIKGALAVQGIGQQHDHVIMHGNMMKPAKRPALPSEPAHDRAMDWKQNQNHVTAQKVEAIRIQRELRKAMMEAFDDYNQNI